MDELTAEVKRWGNSLGLVIPAPVVRRNRLRRGDRVRVRLEPAGLQMKDVVGFLRPHLRNFDVEAALKELERGWEDD